MKAKLVQVIRTETVEGDGKKESPVHSVERYWTLEGELLAEKVYMGKQQEGEARKDEYLRSMENEEMALAVRRKGKSLKDCMAIILKKAFGEKTQLDDRITKAAGLRPPLYISIPGKAQIKEIVREYYLGEKK